MSVECTKYAIVTGANRGIGLACTRALLDAGLHVAMLGRDGYSLADSSAEFGTRVRVVVCDVANSSAVNAAAQVLVSAWGAPQVVVHNAGIVRRAPVDSLSDEAWDASLAVNLSGPFYLTRATMPPMRAAGSGRHVYIASISSTLGTPQLSAYCAAKWGVVGFMKSVAEELRGSGLQAMAVLPGSVDTRMLEGSGFAPQMRPADIASTVVYAALHAPAAMNGSAIEVFGP